MYLAVGVPIHSTSNHRYHVLLPYVWLEEENKVAGVKYRNHWGDERSRS